MSRFKVQPEPQEGELAFVVWHDATSDSGWRSVKHARRAKACRCISVGWIIRHDDKVLTLAASRQERGGSQIGDRLTIPAGWISEILPVEIV